MNNFSDELEEIKKIRHDKYTLSNNLNQVEKPIYNYALRSNTLNWIKKCSVFDVLKERMDRVEKQDYQNKISKIQIDDLKHFSNYDINTNFMIDLFKYSISLQVLKYAYMMYTNSPHILMIKEFIAKPTMTESENFLLELLTDYTKTNKNVLQIITTTVLMVSKYDKAKDFIMDIFYSDSNTYSISYEQLLMIYSNTQINPDKFKFLVTKCSNQSAYSKCSKTFIERSNRDLLKNLIHEVESKYKSKLNIDLYN